MFHVKHPRRDARTRIRRPTYFFPPFGAQSFMPGTAPPTACTSFAGTRVDVYATGGTSTDVLASGVLVLATSASAQESTTDAKVSWITVAVAPESVQEIVAAAQKTELYFTLPGSEGER